MPTPRVTFFSQFFPEPDARFQTGGTLSNLNFLRAFTGVAGLDVVSFDPIADNATAFSSESFRVIHRRAPFRRGIGLVKDWIPFVGREVQKYIYEFEEPDILIATSATLPAFDFLQSRLTKRVAIVRAYENFGFRTTHVPFRQRVQLGKLAMVRRFQDGRWLRQADRVVTNSKFMRNAISERFRIPESRISIIPQLCDIPEPEGDAPASRAVGFVHRGPDKNIAFVLELARLARDIQFRVFGHTDDLKADELPENVQLMGWESDRARMLSSAALWIVPSLWAEPFGRISMEAQAAGRPVVVADRGGLPETTFDSRFRIEGFDRDQWLSRIRELLDIPLDYWRENAARVRAHFSQEAHDRAIKTLVEDLTNRRGN